MNVPEPTDDAKVDVSKPLAPTDWSPSADFVPANITGTAEVVVGVDNLLSIAWLTRGVRMAGSVARILVENRPDKTGTGFLVGDDLMITNNHVLPDEAAALASMVQFNYQRSWSGQFEQTKLYPITEFVKTSKALDYTLVRLGNSPGSLWGHIDTAEYANVAVNDFVVIIQHPDGQAKQVALMDNKVSAVLKPFFQYSTDTQKGSSGSPVFNTRWQLVGLHHAGGQLQDATGSYTFTNEGVQFSDILRDTQGLLGDVDPVYTLCLGAARPDLFRLVELGAPGGNLADAATDFLANHPDLADDLPAVMSDLPAGWTGARKLGITGVAVGAALVEWSRGAAGGSISSAAKIPPGPSDALTAVLADIATQVHDPLSVYTRSVDAMKTRPEVVDNLVVGVPDVPAALVATQHLLRCVSAGAQALAS